MVKNDIGTSVKRSADGAAASAARFAGLQSAQGSERGMSRPSDPRGEGVDTLPGTPPGAARPRREKERPRFNRDSG